MVKGYFGRALPILVRVYQFGGKNQEEKKRMGVALKDER